MKRLSLVIILILCMGIIGFSGCYNIQEVNKLKKYNLSFPKKRLIKIDNKQYSVTLYEYEPPYYIPKYLLKNENDVDYSMPEETILALYSAIGRNRDWYLSLHDKNAQENLIELDKKNNSRILEEYSKEKPLEPPDGSYEDLLYKLEMKFDKKEYAIIQSKNFIKNKEFPGPTHITFVKQKGAWLRTDDLKNSPIKEIEYILSDKSYGNFIKLSIVDIIGTVLQFISGFIFVIAAMGIVLIAIMLKNIKQ